MKLFIKFYVGRNYRDIHIFFYQVVCKCNYISHFYVVFLNNIVDSSKIFFNHRVISILCHNYLDQNN
jgi:hypothetical protein